MKPAGAVNQDRDKPAPPQSLFLSLGNNFTPIMLPAALAPCSQSEVTIFIRDPLPVTFEYLWLINAEGLRLCNTVVLFFFDISARISMMTHFWLEHICKTTPCLHLMASGQRGALRVRPWRLEGKPCLGINLCCLIAIVSKLSVKPADAWMSQPPSMYGTPTTAGKFITVIVYFLSHALQRAGWGAARGSLHFFGCSKS